MEWPKLKNIILVILLTANFFLLVLVGYREALSSNYLANARTDAIGVLERSGISVKEEILPQDGSLTPLSMERDRAQEAKAAAALLGTADESEQGGVTVYTGEKGTARFSRSGEFSAVLNANAYPLGDQTVGEHALATLALLDFEGEIVSTQEDGDSIAVTVRQLWQGTPVYTCQAALVYRGGALVSIREGGSTRLTGTPAQSGDAEDLSTVTALVRFLEGITKLGDVCTSLTGMTPGYVFTAGISDPITLRPVWYITTDTGAYYLDADTGELTRAS